MQTQPEADDSIVRHLVATLDAFAQLPTTGNIDDKALFVQRIGTRPAEITPSFERDAQHPVSVATHT